MFPRSGGLEVLLLLSDGRSSDDFNQEPLNPSCSPWQTLSSFARTTILAACCIASCAVKHMSYYSLEGKILRCKHFLLLLTSLLLMVDRWVIQMICQHWMREVIEGDPSCVKLQFPSTFKGVNSLNCCALTEINELGAAGEASKICPCHEEPVLNFPQAGAILSAMHMLTWKDMQQDP